MSIRKILIAVDDQPLSVRAAEGRRACAGGWRWSGAHPCQRRGLSRRYGNLATAAASLRASCATRHAPCWWCAHRT